MRRPADWAPRSTRTPNDTSRGRTLPADLIAGGAGTTDHPDSLLTHPTTRKAPPMTLAVPIPLSPTISSSRRGAHRATTRSPLMTAVAVSAAATIAIAPATNSTAHRTPLRPGRGLATPSIGIPRPLPLKGSAPGETP